MFRGLGSLFRECGLTPRWSGRMKDRVQNPNVDMRAAQLNR